MSVYDLLEHSINSKPVAFQETLESILEEKVIQALEAKKAVLAASIYESAPEEDEYEPDFEDEDLDDILDFDFDLDEENLEDRDEDFLDDEDLQELSRNTLKNYIRGSEEDSVGLYDKSQNLKKDADGKYIRTPETDKAERKWMKRGDGIERAEAKLRKMRNG